MRLLFTLVAFATVGSYALIGGAAHAGDGPMLYVKGDKLYRAEVKARAKGELVAELGPMGRKVTRIDVNAAGTRALLSSKKAFVWIDLSASQPVPVTVDCVGWARLSPDGNCVLCPGPAGTKEIHWFSPKPGGRSLGDMRALWFQGPRSTEVLVRTGDLFEAVSIAKPTKRRPLAPATDASDLLVAPDGKFAAAVVTDKKGKRVETFLLDGVGTRRRLMVGAVPLFFSRDSKWLAVQAGSRTCVTRALGGQYRCYNGFRAVALSDDNLTALMVKGSTLYKVKLTGARGGVPSVVVGGIRPTAAWLPAPAAVVP